MATATALKTPQLPWTRQQIATKILEKSLYHYVQAAWRVIEPDAFVGGWHIEAICKHLEAITAGRIRNLVVNIPPRHTKSLIVSVLWPSWEWGPANHPGERWLFNSYSSGLSVRDSVKCRMLIQSPWYQERWGDRYQLTGDQNAKERYNTTKNGYRVASSVGGISTGEGGTRCVAAGTIVNTDVGCLSIEKVVAGRGTEVLCLDLPAGKLEYCQIVERMASAGRPLVQIELEDGKVLRCTEDHPVLTVARGYVAAGELTEADEVVVE